MSFASAAAAADIKLLGSPGVSGLLEELAPRFEAETGHKIVADFEVIAKIKRRIDGGERFDIAVLSPEAIASLIARRSISKRRSRGPAWALGFAKVPREASACGFSSTKELIAVALAALGAAHSRGLNPTSIGLFPTWNASAQRASSLC